MCVRGMNSPRLRIKWKEEEQEEEGNATSRSSIPQYTACTAGRIAPSNGRKQIIGITMMTVRNLAIRPFYKMPAKFRVFSSFPTDRASLNIPECIFSEVARPGR